MGVFVVVRMRCLGVVGMMWLIVRVIWVLVMLVGMFGVLMWVIGVVVPVMMFVWMLMVLVSGMMMLMTRSSNRKAIQRIVAYMSMLMLVPMAMRMSVTWMMTGVLLFMVMLMARTRRRKSIDRIDTWREMSMVVVLMFLVSRSVYIARFRIWHCNVSDDGGSNDRVHCSYLTAVRDVCSGCPLARQKSGECDLGVHIVDCLRCGDRCV